MKMCTLTYPIHRAICSHWLKCKLFISNFRYEMPETLTIVAT